jgi:hypothetical protein
VGYKLKRKQSRYVNEERELDFDLVEADGKAGLEIAKRILDAQANGNDKIEGPVLVDLFVYLLSVSIVEQDGQGVTRPLDNDAGRAELANWPIDVLMAAGQEAMTINSAGAAAKN